SLIWLSISLFRRPQSSTLFPYTTLFRSDLDEGELGGIGVDHVVLDAGVAIVRRAGRELRRGLPVDRSAGEHAGGQRDDHVGIVRSEEHTSELQSQSNLVCRLLLEKKKQR